MNTLQAPPGSPWWLHAGAAAILFAHVAGGSLALVAGARALAVRKGSRRHALAGTIFFASMLAMAAIGAAVSPLLVTARGDPRWFDSLAGIFFFGQQQVMPESVQGSPWLAVPPFAVLGLMVFWLARLRLPRRLNRFARKAAA